MLMNFRMIFHTHVLHEKDESFEHPVSYGWYQYHDNNKSNKNKSYQDKKDCI